MAPALPLTTRGLPLTVLRPANGEDYTHGGVSSRVADMTLVGILHEETLAPLPQGSRVFEALPEAPAVALRVRTVLGRRVLSLVPLEASEDGLRAPTCHLMMGGNYATSPDERFHALAATFQEGAFAGALPLHDRFEG